MGKYRRWDGNFGNVAVQTCKHVAIITPKTNSPAGPRSCEMIETACNASSAIRRLVFVCVVAIAKQTCHSGPFRVATINLHARASVYVCVIVCLCVCVFVSVRRFVGSSVRLSVRVRVRVPVFLQPSLAFSAPVLEGDYFCCRGDIAPGQSSEQELARVFWWHGAQDTRLAEVRLTVTPHRRGRPCS